MHKTQEQSFATSYDLTVKLISAVVILGFLIASIITKSAIAGALGLTVVTLGYLYSPRSYEISDQAILVKRLIGTVRLPLESICNFRAGTADDFRGCIRLWASGGFFGYFGLFKTANLGKCKCYMRNRSNSVILVTHQGTVVLSPDDVSGFLAAVRNVVSAPETTGEQTNKEVGTERVGMAIGISVGGLVAIGLACIAYFLLIYSPGLPKLTLTSSTLTIHDRFYPVTINASDIDVSGVKVVDIRTDPEWKPTARTNGFSNRHYHSGWFQVNRGSVRIYWANGEKLILLPSRRSGTPVLLQVDNPEQFIGKVRQAWTNN